VIGLDRVVRMLLNPVQGRGNQLIEPPRVNRRTVRRDLDRDRASAQRPGEEAPGRGQIAPGRQQDVDDLAMLVDRTVEISPPPGNPDAGLIDEPPVAWSVPTGPRRLDELLREPLHPPVNGDVINGDAALGQQLFNVAEGQAVPQVPPDRHRDHLRREPETRKYRDHASWSHQTGLPPSVINQCNSAFAPIRAARR
jgi:hypothetical protein